jgi:hypothetical protein
MLARNFPSLSASVVATLGVLAIWPYVQDRFLTPVLPLVGVCAAFAVDRTVARMPVVVRRSAIAVAALLAVALLGENARLRVESARGAPRSPYAGAITEMVQWIQRHTPVDDHIMTEWGGVLYLRTGRRTSIANPEEPMLGSSVLAAPFQFYASRLLADTVDHVIIWDRAPGRSAAWIRALGSRCPGLLADVESGSPTGGASGVHYYRVRRELPCLHEQAMPRR